MSTADLSAIAVAGGFAEPVFGAQGVFRVLMDATARPGTVVPLAVEVAPPAPLGVGAGAIALALCDADTPVWLSPSLRGDTVAAWIAFQCGAPLSDDEGKADFAFAPAAEAPGLCALSQGSQEYPDRSTTLVLEIEALEGGERLTLQGPGIDGSRVIAPRGLPADFLAARADNRLLFPRGIDVVLVAGSEILALPRSTVIAATDMEAR
ncbi:phosphonate C-P lyase system protein PhnH [Stappia sp. ICDLI1TA098]